ncbi:hypothetical protein Pan44_55250 [Caulifigura coniformis]|uniref:TadE-like protein n=1 Tax=Caulifigura coniformis TaxID=2527983 RepID=A0A517SMX9_9PLAN|nr:hypothetical protein Pan44_55250 [Caulifigura coniformis]
MLPVAFLILFSGLDVALTVQRQTMLTECACRAARRVIVAGEFSKTAMQPTTWTGTAADTHPIAAAIRPLLATLTPSIVGIKVQWLDGANSAGKKIQVELSSEAPTVIPRLFGAKWNLTARSTMLIAN